MELRTPIRILWDLPPSAAEECFDPYAICAQIVALRVLSLDLLDGGAQLSRASLAVLEELRGKSVAVTLTVSATHIQTSVREQLHSLGIKVLLMSVSSLEELRSLAAAGWPWNIPTDIQQGISFPVNNTNCRELPELLSFCMEHGAQQLVFPIFRAKPGSRLSYPDTRQREWLGREPRVASRPENLRLTIHDPFLWKVFYPERPFPDGGCQAGNTMLYIAPDASVYPCPSMPFRLGNLNESSLTEITAAPEKRRIRQQLLAAPAECATCAVLPQCLGGCRGRGYVRYASWDAADPACR